MKDVILAIVILFIFAIGFFSFYFMFNVSIDKLLNNSVVNSSQAAVDSFNEAKALSNRMDYVFFIVLMAVVLGIIITGWFIGGHPILMFVYFIIAVIATVIATVFHYVWEQVSEASVFGTTNLAFPIMNHIMTNIEIYTPIMAFLGVIAMFARPYLTSDKI